MVLESRLIYCYLFMIILLKINLEDDLIFFMQLVINWFRYWFALDPQEVLRNLFWKQMVLQICQVVHQRCLILMRPFFWKCCPSYILTTSLSLTLYSQIFFFSKTFLFQSTFDGSIYLFGLTWYQPESTLLAAYIIHFHYFYYPFLVVLNDDYLLNKEFVMSLPKD